MDSCAPSHVSVPIRHENWLYDINNSTTPTPQRIWAILPKFAPGLLGFLMGHCMPAAVKTSPGWQLCTPFPCWWRASSVVHCDGERSEWLRSDALRGHTACQPHYWKRKVEMGLFLHLPSLKSARIKCRAVKGSSPKPQHLPGPAQGRAGWMDTQGDTVYCMVHNLKQHTYRPLDRDVVED